MKIERIERLALADKVKALKALAPLGVYAEIRLDHAKIVATRGNVVVTPIIRGRGKVRYHNIARRLP